MNLVPLFEEALEFQNYNGTVLSNGKAAVYYIGRTRLADIYNDVAAEYPAENPRILNNLGMGPVYVNPAFDYELVVFDEYNNELFSVKKYLHSKGEHSTANVVVTPSENIAVSAWTIGDVQVYMPYLTGQLGKVYTGIDPIVVNNTEDKISANHVALGVQDPLYFVQDDEEGCIIGFSGQTVPEGVMTESALGFENNKITGYNGSAFSAGNTYEEGSYISIADNTISVTGLTPVPSDTASTGLVAQVSADIVSQIPSTAGLATTAQLDEKLDKSDSGNFYPMDSNPSGYLTGLPSDLATTGWVDSQGYLTAVDIPESAVWNATTQTVSANSAAWAGGTANPQIPVTSTSGISIFESGDKVYFNISANYATEDWVTGQGYLTAETDWSDTITAASANAYEQATAAIPTGLATEDWVTAQGYLTASYNPEFAYHDTAISSIDNSALYDTSAHARINTLAGRISDLSSNKLDTTAFSDVSGTFLTAHQDLSDYQTTAGMTAYQPVGSYLTADALDSVSGDWNEVSAKLDTTAFSDVSGTFLTAHQDISNKLDTTAFSDVSGSFLTGIPDTYLQNTDLFTEDGKVTAISGIPLSAGGDVPEGVMVESGLEYNAVNEISAYNGSAIAQYGAEKQWLVTDDTLVHASNSAQYALGVNVSAVKTLMGLNQPNQWIDVKNEVNYNSNAILAGGFNIIYNPFLKMVNLTCDVQVKAGSVARNFMTWTERLKPATDTQFALGEGLYVSSGELLQPNTQPQRWINHCWCWGVKGE